ncbi:MAG: HEPN domain-containing protein, partial [Acidobacteriota bacterium]
FFGTLGHRISPTSRSLKGNSKSLNQAAEKSLKALFLALGGEAWGHSVTLLLRDLSSKIAVPKDVEEADARLDKHYLLTPYPNGFDAGAPVDYYTLHEAEQAVGDA